MPGTVYVALGAVVAALVAGFFSFSNLVSAKENKVSEFRQAWIDGLRNEIAAHTAAVQDLVRLRALNGSRGLDKDWYEATRETYRLASESLTKIQLRINPTQAAKAPNSHEAKLLNISLTRERFLAKKNMRVHSISAMKSGKLLLSFSKMNGSASSMVNYGTKEFVIGRK